MKKLPIICKFTYPYKYRGMLKEKILYALLLEYSADRKAYYANLIKENGKTHGRHYDRWLNWDKDTIIKSMIPMQDLPKKALKTVIEQIEIFEEINRACKH